MPRLFTAATWHLLLGGARGHNWINSPDSRATKASQVSPCLPPLAGGRTPHVRVNANTTFLIEWASGHPGSFHYIVQLAVRG